MPFDLQLQSHRAQLVLTALAASAVTAGALTAYQRHTRHKKRESLNEDILRSLAASDERDSIAHKIRIGASIDETQTQEERKANFFTASPWESGVGSSVAGGTPAETVLPPPGASYSEELIREQDM